MMASDDGLMSYFARIGLDASEFLGGINKADSGILQFYRDVSVSMAATGLIFDKFLQYGSLVVSKIYQIGASAQELQDLSYTLNISTTHLQQLQYTAALSGTNFGVVQQALSKLSLSIADAGDESTAAAQAFKQLGVSHDGRSIDDVFDDTSVALVGMENITDRNRIAMDLYGRSWKDLLPFMQTYIDKAKEIKENQYLTEEDLAANADAKMQLDALGIKVQNLEGKILAGPSQYMSDSQLMAKQKLAELAGKDDVYSNFLRWQYARDAGISLDTGSARSGNEPRISGGSEYSGYTASTPTRTIDPFAGLTSSEAEIKNLSDYTIPDLEKAYNNLMAAAVPDMEAIRAASLELSTAKENLIALTAKETDAQEKLVDKAIENIKAGVLSVNDLKYAWDKGNISVQQYNEILAGAKGKTEELTRAVEAYNDALNEKEYSTQDYLENVQNAGMDMSKIRQLSLANKQDVREQDRNIAKAQSAISAAAPNVKYGDVIVQVNGKDIVKVAGVAAGGVSKESRIQKGVPTST